MKEHQPDIKPLFDKLNLQNNIKEVKFKHIAKGEFIDCLKSEKLNMLFEIPLGATIYTFIIRSLNILYWSIADIVDSAIVNSEVAMKLGYKFRESSKK